MENCDADSNLAEIMKSCDLDSNSQHVTDHVNPPRLGEETFYKLRTTYRKKKTPLIEYYKMDGERRGDAVIINIENFDEKTGKEKRVGTNADATNLKSTFAKLKFEVAIHKDKSCRNIEKIFEKLASKDHTGSDSFMCAILSHGDDGCIYGTDGIVKIRKIVDMFRGDVCPSLVGKPKIFIFQTCREMKREIPVPSARDVTDGCFDRNPVPQRTVVIDSGPTPTLPSESDFLFCYSVAEGFFSHRDTLYGSWYIQDLTHAIDNLVLKDSEPVNFLHVLTAVNKKVSARQVEWSKSLEDLGKKQMPCFLSMFSKILNFPV